MDKSQIIEMEQTRNFLIRMDFFYVKTFFFLFEDKGIYIQLIESFLIQQTNSDGQS